MTSTVRTISVPNPDFPFEPPIFEGDSDSAMDKIIPGVYTAWDMNTEEYGTLTVTESGSEFKIDEWRA